MTKLKLKIQESGAINASGNITLCTTSDPAEIAMLEKLLFVGDAQDMDGGALDGDIDYERKDKLLGFMTEKTHVTLYLEEE